MTIYTFAEGVPCSHCGNDERTILVVEGLRPEGPRSEGEGSHPEVGVCETCSVDLYWAWKQLLADAAPTSGAPADRVSRVKVMIARRKRSSLGVAEPAEISSSYEVFMVSMPDGTLDLPTADVAPGEPEVDAARRALAQSGIATWPAFLDSLYTAHVPRGSLCRVYLARAYTTPSAFLEAPSSPWRDWPIGQHAPAMAGFYLALRDIWPLVLRAPRSLAVGSRTLGSRTLGSQTLGSQTLGSQTLGSQTLSEICVHVRRATFELIGIQQQIRSGVTGVDTSMVEYLRRGMTDDERLVERALVKEEALEREAQANTVPAVDMAVGKRGEAKSPVQGAEEISDSDGEFDPTSDGKTFGIDELSTDVGNSLSEREDDEDVE